MRKLTVGILLLLAVTPLLAQKPRARDLGIPFDGLPGRKNALTDVPGVEVDVVLATEEAIVNALVAGETMTGMEGHRIDAIPHDRLKAALKRYGRLNP
jgi:D-aminopeptidase